MPAPSRVALVTGGGRGIGRAIALGLARERAPVAVAARTLAQVEAVAGEIRALGGRALALRLDVTCPGSVREAFAACREALGPPLVLVNNAGIAPTAKLLDTSDDTWSAVLATNLDGPRRCIQAALPAMQEARFGRIVNIASTAALTGFRYTTAYCASKHALLGLTRALALELAGSGVTVNAVCPGFTRSEITRESARRIARRTGRSPEAAEAELARLSPAGRLLEPEEVARVVVLLAAAESAGISGQAWTVDPGGVLH